ncbi:MAG TPA: histidine kinase, partial [Acidobacteriota bacterium]|nr:histidine kinase [Acidobacteriota bacterium]
MEIVSSSEISPLKKWLVLFAICTFLGLLSFSTMYTEELLDGGPTPPLIFVVNEATGAYGVFVLLPAVLWFIRKFRFKKSTWFLMVPAHLLGSMVFGTAHTLIMTGSRIWLYAALDLGPYPMGDPVYRFLMEYQKQALAYAGILVTVYLIIAYRENREREKKTTRLELQGAQLQSRLKETQLQALKGQLQPHFLFNTLNMISSLMYEDVEKADSMITKLSDLLRMSLEHTDRETIPLSQEIEFAEAYLQIMRSRFKDRLEFHRDVDSSLLQTHVPVFLLQPLIENAIKYGDQGAASKLLVTLSAQTKGDHLQLEIRDNGPGHAGDSQEALGKGVGLS